jgi:acetyltransferase-like isoleucine patch superfamily enzyme
MQKIKLFIKRQGAFRAYLFSRSVGFGVIVVNFIFQAIFRIDPGRLSKNYTSRLIAFDNLAIENDCIEVRKSLAVSGGCYLQATHGISIGENTIWSFNVSMVTSDHDLSDYRLENSSKSGPITIGSNCWIGAGVTILPKVSLGANTVVGANSVVTTSFPQGNVILAGCPARVIREL